MRLCFERGLDCTETCCKGTYCSPKIGECIHYVHRDFSEIYICFAVVFAIVLGIPTCIRTMELLLMYKFCQKKNDDEGTLSGGKTLLEAMTVCWARGENKDAVIQQKEEEDGEAQAEIEMEQHVAASLNEASEKKAGGGVLKNKKAKEGKKGTCKTIFLACCCCKTDNTVYLPLDNKDLDVSKNKGKNSVGFAENSAMH